MVRRVRDPRVAQGDVEQVEYRQLGGKLKVERVTETDVDVEARRERRERRHRVGDVLLLVLSHRLRLLRVHRLEVALGRVVPAAGVLVQDPRRDEAHELLGGHLWPVGRALEGDGVAQEQHVDDADERARAVLVLAHDGALGAEEVDALHLEEVPVVVVPCGLGRGGHLGAVARRGWGGAPPGDGRPRESGEDVSKAPVNLAVSENRRDARAPRRSGALRRPPPALYY